MSFEKFRILFWKNWTLQRRKPISGLFQIAFPIVIVVLATWGRSAFGNQFDAFEEIIEEKFELDLSDCTFKTPLTNVFFAPDNVAYRTLIEGAFGGFQIQGFPDPGIMWDEVYNQDNQTVGIILTTSDSEVTVTLPKTLKHSIILIEYDSRNCRLAVQSLLERGIIKTYGQSSYLRDVIMRSFPYEHQFKQIYTEVMMLVLSIFLVFAMFGTVSEIIKSVVSERESKMKEMMKIMGLSSPLHWSSWFVKCLIMSTISYTIVTVFLCIPIIGSTAIFSHSNFFLIWLFFFMYCIGVVTLCFMISTFFTKASIAGNVGVLLFFSTYVPFYVYGTNFEELNHVVKWLFCLPINTALGQGIALALNMELNREGITFSNMFSSINGFGFSYFEVLMTMLLATIIHLLIMTYIEMVFPGDVGVPKPWYFPVACLIRKSDKNSLNHTHYDNNNENNSSSPGDYEEEPKHLNAKVRLEKLTKSFGNFKAVNNLSLNIYEDQITVLLAHNGGGKTTTMNMLIGMLPPSSGTAYINDFDITTNIVDARKSLGICPQHNILFTDLTVREHIVFFCRLKGMHNSKEIEHEVQKYINMMDLNDKKNKKSKELSGGQQRKLSIANALCGNSTFVVLDEPTSGLDVKARRNLWDLLIQEKKGRTILLSTHYMDEADVLGDRIAIMNEGMLKTVGTSFFLKKKFGSGYRLIIVKNSKCDSMKILNILKQYAPDASIDSEEQMEVIYVLSEEYLDKFDKIFKHLEDDTINLGIESFGCSLTTLEEVFLKIGVEKDEKIPNGKETAINFNSHMSFKKVSTLTLMVNQIYAMALKKFHFSRRNYAPYIIFGLLTAWLTFVFLAAPMSFSTFDFWQSLSGVIQTNNPNSAVVTEYKSFFKASDVVVIDEDIRDFIFGNFLRRNQRYQIGVSINGDSASVWYNYYHSFNDISNLALNYYHRAVLRELTDNDHDINLEFNPFNNYIDKQEFDDVVGANEVRNPWEDITVYILFFFILTYWPSIHISLRIKERMTKAKLLQFISGANKFIFEFTAYIIDVVITLAIMLIFLGVVFAFNRPGFNTAEDFALHCTLFTFYIINMIAFVHLMSFWFKKHSTGDVMAQLIPIAFGVLYVAYAILYESIRGDISKPIGLILYWIGIFFAPFNYIHCVVKVLDLAIFGDEEVDNLWSFSDAGILKMFSLNAAGTIIFLTIILLKDYLVFMWLRYKLFNRSPKLPPPNTEIDDDVKNEIERVKSKTASQIIDNNLVLNGLTKFYGNHLAVNDLHVGVEASECFGLLGVNGAGKTSVFKMLTGDEMITSGSAWIHGFSLINQIPKVYNEIGYCPQYDAVLPDLSGYETMKIFCLLRGIPRDEIDDVIESYAYELDFMKHINKKVSDLSGGNRRKLSTVLSLLGNLSLIFLDECSSGIDAKAKRQLWNIINKTRNAGKAIVITSHSMQECESLCTRLAIMVDGEFRCLGSIQHLKNKFSKGFILKIMMSQRDDEDHFNAIQARVVLSFPMAQLKETFMGLLTFHIDIPELKWSSVFAELAQMKTEMGINDYTMTQSSLESVFLFFSKQGKRKSD